MAAKKNAKTVVIKLPLTRTEKEPVFVGLNGKTWLIQRGVNVSVPYGVYKILQRQEQALTMVMAAMEEAQKKADF